MNNSIIIRNVFSILLIYIIVLLSGCGVKPDKSIDSTTWMYDELTFSGPCSWCDIRGDILLVYSSTDNVVYEIDLNSGETKRILELCNIIKPVEHTRTEETLTYETISKIALGPNLVWFIKMETEYSNNTLINVSLQLVGVDWAGSVMYESAINAFDFDGTLAFTDMFPTSLVLLPDNTLVVSVDQYILQYDSSAELIAIIPTNASISNMVIDHVGDLYCVLSNGKVSRVNFCTKQLSEPSIILDGNTLGVNSAHNYFDFVENRIDGLYGINHSNGRRDLLFKWEDVHFLPNMIVHTYILGDGSFLIMYSDGFSLEYHICKMSKVANNSQSTETLTIGRIGDNKDSVLSNLVMAYNRSNNYTHAEIISYSDSDSLKLALVAGEGPDVVFYDYLGPFQEELFSTGVLRDLYEFIDNDQELSREDFVDNYLLSMEQNGKLYEISSGFRLVGLGIQSEHTEPHNTMKSLLASTQSVNEDTLMLGVDSFGFVKKMLQLSYSNYIDFDAGTCNFCDDSFLCLLELAKRNVNCTSFDEQNAYLKIMDFSGFRASAELIRSEWSLISIPEQKETTKIKPFMERFSISSGSKNAEQAWNFIKFSLADEYQISRNNSFAFPVMDEAFIYLEENAIENGWLTPSENKTILELIKNTKEKRLYASPVFQIVEEEVAYYFSGSKTAEETAEIIQNRVQTYMFEQH